jgi:hypothetical protein
MRAVESFLPVFYGTYGTIFEDMILDDNSGEQCVKFVNKNIKELGIQAVFQKIVSPKFYNFSNDSIYVEYQFENLNKLNAYLIDNRDEFTEYLEGRYTSRDGFISHHSSDVDEWISVFMFGGDLTHKLGAALDFYCEMEGVEDVDMHEDLCMNGCVIYEDENL